MTSNAAHREPEDLEQANDVSNPPLDRRSFLGGVTGAAAIGASGIVLPSLVGSNPAAAQAAGAPSAQFPGPGANAMTVETELNKLAMNVAYGRHIAGVHWRSDGYESLRLGEQLAIRILGEQRYTYAENFNGFTFRRFDGTTCTV